MSENIIYAGLVANGATAIIQARTSVDYLDCELLEFYGARENTFDGLRQAFQQNYAQVLAQLQKDYPERHFSSVELDTSDRDANYKYADCRGDTMGMLAQELKQNKENAPKTELTQPQIDEMKRLKQYYPYRIVWANIVDGQFQCYASFNRRAMNTSARKGYPTFSI